MLDSALHAACCREENLVSQSQLPLARRAGLASCRGREADLKKQPHHTAAERDRFKNCKRGAMSACHAKNWLATHRPQSWVARWRRRGCRRQ